MTPVALRRLALVLAVAVGLGLAWAAYLLLEARDLVTRQEQAVAALGPVSDDIAVLALAGRDAPPISEALRRALERVVRELGAPARAYLTLRREAAGRPHPFAARHAAARFAAALATRAGVAAARDRRCGGSPMCRLR